jgi:hypothetical protein
MSPCLVGQGVYVVSGLVDRGKEQGGTKHCDMKMAAWIVNDGALLIPIPMAVLMSYSLSSIQ